MCISSMFEYALLDRIFVFPETESGTTVSEPAFTSHGDGGKELRRKHAGPSGLFFFVAALPCFLFKVSKVTKLSSYFDLFLGMVRMVSKSNGLMVPYTYGHCMYRYVDRVRLRLTELQKKTYVYRII